MCNTRWKAYCIVLKNTSRPARGLLCLVPSCLCLNLRLHPCFVCISVRVCVRLSLSLSLSLSTLSSLPLSFCHKISFPLSELADTKSCAGPSTLLVAGDPRIPCVFERLVNE